MPTQKAAISLIGKFLAERIQDISYDPGALTSWETGDLSGKLRPIQRRMLEAMRATLAGDFAHRSLKFIFHCSRRLGKTFLMLVDANEIGMTELNAPLKFAGPTREQIKNIARPIFREITMDCPRALRPIWKAADHRYLFPKTGTELVMEGCSQGHEENLRGVACRKGYIDEAQAFKHNLKYVVQDILMPQLITTGGSLVIAGTSPKTPVHDFAKMIQEAKGHKNYISFPIHDAGYAPDVVAKFCEEAGGEKSSTWRREYLNELLIDEESAVIPEWKAAYEVEPVRDDFFKFYHKYESMDIGGRRDRTATLFGWYDFKRAKLCIAAESCVPPKDMTTKAIADGVKKKEVDIFGKLPLKLRVADSNNEILLKDLGSDHGLHFVPTSKDTLEAMVNQARLWVAAGRVEVSPEAVELLGCLRYGIWNKKRNDFERFPEESDAHKLFGHFDALAAFIYLVRNVNTHENPVPHDFKLSLDTHFIPPAPPEAAAAVITQAFRPRFRR